MPGGACDEMLTVRVDDALVPGSGVSSDGENVRSRPGGASLESR